MSNGTDAPTTLMNFQALQPAQSTIQNNKIVPAFLSRFINPDFVEKIIKVTLFQADFSTLSTRSVDIIKFIQKFLRDAQQDVRRSPSNYFKVPKNILISSLQLTQQVLELREDVSARLVTYDNILQHFPKRDLNTEKLLRNVSTNRITDINIFRQTFDIIVQTIQSYNEITQIKKTLTYWDAFLEETEKDNSSVLNVIRSYRDLVATSYNDLSLLTTVTKNDELDDYMILSDPTSIGKVVSNVTKYLSTGYSFYKTGYSLIDENIGGLESSTFHLITGPSNHAKSIFMVNLCHGVIVNNSKSFEDGDTIVFITLEDDAYKLLRRFISVFGNIDTSMIQRLFIKASSLMKNNSYKDMNNQSALNSEVSKVLTKLLTDTIIKVTNKRCQVIIKHCNENMFSPGDATKFVDLLRLEGFNVKLLLIDYVDVMVPTSSRYSNYNDYDAQGAIIQELRLASRIYSIPIVSITQNSRTSENSAISMDNSLIGDSYKKIRYSDYVYMVRMRIDCDLLSPQVKGDVCENADEDIPMLDMTGNFVNKLVAFEIKITKAKEGKKDMIKFHLFSGTNLRIYDSLNTFFMDLPSFKQISGDLKNQIDLLGMSNMQQFDSDQQQFEINLL